MKELRRRVRILTAFVVLCVAGLALWMLCSVTERNHKVVFSDSSYLIVRKVSYGKNNVYWHHSLHRAAAALGIEGAWERGVGKFPWLFSRMGATEVNSSCQTEGDELVVFGEFYPGLAKTRSLQFTGVDGEGKESGPLGTEMLVDSSGRTNINTCILADGKVPNSWPISVRIYERGTNGTRKLLAQLPAKQAEK